MLASKPMPEPASAPQTHCESLRVNVERVKHWQGKGAQLSLTVKRLVKQFGKKAA